MVSRFLRTELKVSSYTSHSIDGRHKGYSFSGDPMEIFESFFGTANPFHIALDEHGQQVPLIQKIESDLHKDFVTDVSIREADLVLNI
jgi:hypothetical protein